MHVRGFIWEEEAALHAEKRVASFTCRSQMMLILSKQGRGMNLPRLNKLGKENQGEKVGFGNLQPSEFQQQSG